MTDLKESFRGAGTQARNCQTQIIATLGPASSSYETIRTLYEAGVDCFRLNFSHGTHEDHRKSAEIIRQIERDTGAVIGIMADLQGPKLRIGTFSGGSITLREGMRLRFDLDPTPGDEKRVCFPHPEIIKALEPGAKFLMDDGNVGMVIAEKGDGYVTAEVRYGEKLSDRKGVNVPDLSLPVQTLTPKDRTDLEFALSLGVDWIAQSFVQTGADVEECKALIAGRAKHIVKMEKPAAVKNADEIIAAADAIMVARGDLGVEIPFEQVPAVQKVLTYKGRIAGKPVVIATQMMDSMRENPRPTRAEVSDVAQAVFDGASAVMLSGETSVGKFPVPSVEAMDKICFEMENGTIYNLALQAEDKAPRRATPFVPRPPKPPVSGPGGKSSPAP
jgi:pyruvate kinase